VSDEKRQIRKKTEIIWRGQDENISPLPRVATSDSRQRTADSRQQTADSRQQTANSRQQTTDSRQQTADSRQQTTDNRQQTADSRQQTARGYMSPLPRVASAYCDSFCILCWSLNNTQICWKTESS
jgi:hypothetical protein